MRMTVNLQMVVVSAMLAECYDHSGVMCKYTDDCTRTGW